MASFRITEETPYTDPHSRGTGSIVTQRTGYILRTRGDHGHLVRHDYRCPVHGVRERIVPSGDVPDTMPCDERLYSVTPGWTHVWTECDLESPWVSPIVAQGLSAGSVKR